MPAQTKDELIAVSEKEYAKLEKNLGQISEEAALRKREEDTSIKDIVVHRAHWIDLFLGWYADGKAGREVHIPAPGYNWGQLKAYNADLRAKTADVRWNEALGTLADRHRALMALIDGLDNDQLYGGPMPGGGKNRWTTGRFAEASGPSHYRSAAK